MKKKLVAVVLCLILVLTMPLSVLAAQEANLVQETWINGPEMTMICSGAEDAPGKYQVTIAGKDITMQKSNIRTAKIPMTVFCLVDTSGSISEYKMRLIRQTLQTISDSLSTSDNMVIAQLDNNLEVGSLLRTKKARNDVINGIQATYEDTNLYAGIVESVHKLTSDSTYHDYGCVVVLSDGKDCQDNGMTEKEVMTAVQESRVPVFTVALVQNADEREDAKVMGSFARGSYGGVHQSTVSDEGGNKPIRWDADGAEFGKEILDTMQNMAVLKGNLEELEIDESQNEVRVDVRLTAGTNVYTDTLKMNVSDFADIHPETTEAEPAENENKDTLIWILIGCGLVVLALVILIVAKKRSKKKAAAAAAPEPEAEQAAFSGVPDDIQQPAASVIPDSAFLQQRYQVHLADIPYGAQKHSFTVNAVEVVTFGRDPRRVQCVVSTTDNQLSGKHFSMTLQQSHYCIRDDDSKNGTYHNGVPIAGKGWVKFESGDRIRVGAYEYRVVIEPVQ